MRCTGHCCRNFTIPITPDQLKNKEYGTFNKEDFDRIAEVVVYLGEGVGGKNGHRYTCSKLLPNGDCGDYENRPKMCREYPYGEECKVVGCTMKEVV